MLQWSKEPPDTRDQDVIEFVMELDISTAVEETSPKYAMIYLNLTAISKLNTIP